jgi:hypothetical protein
VNTGRTSLLCFLLFFVALFAAIPLIEVSPAVALAAAVAPAPPAQPTPECVVPKLHGKKLKAARKKVAKADCKLGKVTRKGTAGKRAKVVKQKPKPGTTRAPRSKVNVVLGRR